MKTIFRKIFDISDNEPAGKEHDCYTRDVEMNSDSYSRDEAGPAPAVKLSSEDNYRLGLERYEKKAYRKAMEYLLKAAEEGMGKASIMIGELYEKGQGVEKSNQRALEWYFKAYQQGEPKGMEYYQALYFRSKARW